MFIKSILLNNKNFWLKRINLKLLFIKKEYITLVIIGLTLANTFCGNIKEGSMSNVVPIQDTLLNEWFNSVAIIPKDKWVLCNKLGEIKNPVIIESKATFSLFIREEYDPYRNQSLNLVATSMFVGENNEPDLLKYEYHFDRLNISVFEGCNFLMMMITPVAENVLPKENISKYLYTLTHNVVKINTQFHNWDFQISENIPDFKTFNHFTTENPPAIKELFGRHDRADIIIFNDSIYYVFYKKIEQLLDFKHGNTWFNDKLRAAIKTMQ